MNAWFGIPAHAEAAEPAAEGAAAPAAEADHAAAPAADLLEKAIYAEETQGDLSGAIKLYKQSYRPSARHPKPRSGLCVWALAAETEEEAQFHFSSRARFRLLRDRGIFSALEAPAPALAHPYTEAELARIAEQRKAAFVGTGAQVAERIDELARRLNVQEMAVVTWAYDEGVRRASYRLLAQAMGFAPDMP